jgi:hypothetical protein
MKEEIYKICTKLNDGQIAVVEAQEQLLRLFSVVGQSEQLVCDVCESTDDVQTYCGKCIEERC